MGFSGCKVNHDRVGIQSDTTMYTSTIYSLVTILIKSMLFYDPVAVSHTDKG